MAAGVQRTGGCRRGDDAGRWTALVTQSTELESALTCPECGCVTTETMPTDACIYFFECPGCHELLQPKSGHCCVFCSYGTVACPPIQESRACCTGR